MSEDAKPEGEGHEAPKKGKKKIVIIAIVLLLVLGGVGGFMAMGGKKADEASKEHVEEEKHYITGKLDTFIVNLSQSGSFLKVSMLLEYDAAQAMGNHGGADGGGGHGGGGSGGGGDAEAGGFPGVMGKRQPMIRDAVIRILSSKKGEEVLTVQGKEALKEELVDGINEAIGLDEGPVVAVYFTEFIVQ